MWKSEGGLFTFLGDPRNDFIILVKIVGDQTGTVIILDINVVTFISNLVIGLFALRGLFIGLRRIVFWSRDFIARDSGVSLASLAITLRRGTATPAANNEFGIKFGLTPGADDGCSVKIIKAHAA